MTKLEHDRIVKRETMFGNSILIMLESLKTYAQCHREAYESPIGEDYVMGEYWKQMASGLIGLLNGETGTLDCGHIDGAIRKLARANGFSEQEIDSL
jgi:hypothetical protein